VKKDIGELFPRRSTVRNIAVLELDVIHLKTFKLILNDLVFGFVRKVHDAILMYIENKVALARRDTLRTRKMKPSRIQWDFRIIEQMRCEESAEVN
jgi:hypothetical protein